MPITIGTIKRTSGEIMKKSIMFIFITALLLADLISFTGVVNAETTLQSIHIKPDGTIEPTNVPIQRNGDVYTFTADICGTIIVEKDNITIDGAGYILYGTYNGTRTDSWEVGQGPDQELSNGTLWTIGIDFHVALRPDNLTVKNLNIKNFYIGMYMWTSGNIITKSSVTDNIMGILLSGDSNTIQENYIARNDQGVFFGVNSPGNEPLHIVLAHNSFVDNAVQFSGCFCEDYNTEENIHTWDDGSKGNYWSDYNGTDTNGDGIGDTPYVIDILNQDRYPLVKVFTVPLVRTTNPGEPIELIILAIALAAISVAAIIVYNRKQKSRFTKPSNNTLRYFRQISLNLHPMTKGKLNCRVKLNLY